MAHTYTNILIHGLFSTKDRAGWLTPEVRSEVFDYLGGTVNRLRGQSLLVNGVSDHVHLLFVQPAALSLADLMEKVKANSSGWVKRRWTALPRFCMADGLYGIQCEQVSGGSCPTVHREARGAPQENQLSRRSRRLAEETRNRLRH